MAFPKWLTWPNIIATVVSLSPVVVPALAFVPPLAAGLACCISLVVGAWLWVDVSTSDAPYRVLAATAAMIHALLSLAYLILEHFMSDWPSSLGVYFALHVGTFTTCSLVVICTGLASPTSIGVARRNRLRGIVNVVMYPLILLATLTAWLFRISSASDAISAMIYGLRRLRLDRNEANQGLDTPLDFNALFMQEEQEQQEDTPDDEQPLLPDAADPDDIELMCKTKPLPLFTTRLQNAFLDLPPSYSRLSSDSTAETTTDLPLYRPILHSLDSYP